MLAELAGRAAIHAILFVSARSAIAASSVAASASSPHIPPMRMLTARRLGA